MSTNSRTDHFFVYPKDKQGNYLGVTICVLLRDGRMYHGEALCSENDQFNKNVGRRLSYDRAYNEYVRDNDFRQIQETDECPAVQEALDSCQNDCVETCDEHQVEQEPRPYFNTKQCRVEEWEVPQNQDHKSEDTWLLSYDKYDTKQLYKIKHYQFQDGTHTGNGLEVSAHPDDKGWSDKAKEKPLLELVDDGNGVDVVLGDDVMRFNYGEFQDITMLYKAWRKYCTHGKDKFKRLK